MRTILNRFLPAFCAVVLVGCGGGGGGSSAPPPPPPPSAPSGLSYPTPQVFTLGVAITTLNPTVTGTPTSYSVTPALPAGLTLNAATGTITGTATALQPATNHQVTAISAGGSTMATLSIAVNDIAPSIAYPQANYTLTVGVPAAGIVPTVTGGTVESWSINHALPTGLNFNINTGQISGSPTATSAPGTYVITALNSGGSDTFDMTLSVTPSAGTGVLLELGHVDEIDSIQYQGARIVSADTGGGVAMWNASSGAMLLNTRSDCDYTCIHLSALAGPTVVVRKRSGFEVYSSVDASPISQIASPTALPNEVSNWKLAFDGSYLASGQLTDLKAWSPAGDLLFTRAGNYASGKIIAAAGEVRAAVGPAGAQVIETIAIPSGAATTSPPFEGTFHSWFPDGERFLTVTGNTVRVYSKTGVQQDIAALPTIENLAGQGNWFWTLTLNKTLRIYSIGASAAPAATYALNIAASLSADGNTLAVRIYGGPERISIIDLAGATPIKTDYVSPFYFNSGYAARSSTDWVVGNREGVLLGGLGSGTPHRYSLGLPRSIAAGGDRVAVATGADKILHFNASSRTLENEIGFSSSKIALSADGTVLAAAANDLLSQYSTDRTLRVYSMPSQAVLAQWPAIFGQDPLPIDFALSATGDVVGRVVSQSAGGGFNVTRSTSRLDGTVLWSHSASSPSFDEKLRIHLSPTGALVAVNDSGASYATATNIYVDGALTGAAQGWPVGWLDNSRLLVNRYGRFTGFTGADIVNAQGQTIASPPLVELHGIQPLGGNLAYIQELNVILDATTGDTVWSSSAPLPTSPYGRRGAVAGGYVFFLSGSTIRAEPR